MDKNIQLIQTFFESTYSGIKIRTKRPSWLSGARWTPDFLFSCGKLLIAADLLPSGHIPRYQYLNIVSKILKSHKEFRVYVIALENNITKDPEITDFCRENTLGLLALVPGVGIEIVNDLEIAPKQTHRQLIQERGWFPKAILSNAQNLSNLCFYKIINDFINQIDDCAENSDKTKNLIKKTIDQLLAFHPSFRNNIHKFMKLSHFEELLRLANPKTSDHVFHSFRVFLAGCPIINNFYSDFRDAHSNISIINKTKLRVEYIWLLTSIFHDIGRPKEGARQFICEQIEDEDVEVIIRGKESRWIRENYMTARRVLGSLAAFVSTTDGHSQWDGGTIECENSDKITTEWINSYDNMKSHAIISAFDFLADIMLKAKSASETANRPFVISHAVPASLAILLHDWKTWEDARKLKLIPVDYNILPIAALLIFIDTWDNFKRRGSNSRINIKKYTINNKGATVVIEWGDPDSLKKDEIGYVEFKKAIKKGGCSFHIKYGLVGEV